MGIDQIHDRLSEILIRADALQKSYGFAPHALLRFEFGKLLEEIKSEVYGRYSAADYLMVDPKWLDAREADGEFRSHNGEGYYLYGELREYKERIDREASKAFDELVRVSEEMGLYSEDDS